MIELIEKTQLAQRKAALDRIRSRSVDLDSELLNAVGSIINDVRQRGDAAVIDYTAKFDGVQLRPNELRIDVGIIRELAQHVDPLVLEALREAIRNVRTFHERQLEQSWQFSPTAGILLGQRITALARVGLYVPGGTAAYPSSVVMNVVPAQVAGVERIVVMTPPRTLAENPAISAALVELNISEIYGIGGAQGIAALAFGTETIPAVDKITGPGNRYVAAAKKLLFGTVGIDSIAGPSEVVIIADETAQPHFIAADLLAQAEHNEDSAAVLITTSGKVANEVAAEVIKQSISLPRRSLVETSLARYGAIFIVADLSEAGSLANELAPEHLELITRDDETVAAYVRNAGAIFFGPYTPEAVGDYFAGPCHVLPTGGAARFSSGLGVYDFVKRTSILRYSRESVCRSAQQIAALAQAEGLDAHARSVLIRSDSN